MSYRPTHKADWNATPGYRSRPLGWLVRTVTTAGPFLLAWWTLPADAVSTAAVAAHFALFVVPMYLLAAAAYVSDGVVEDYRVSPWYALVALAVLGFGYLLMEVVEALDPLYATTLVALYLLEVAYSHYEAFGNRHVPSARRSLRSLALS